MIGGVCRLGPYETLKFESGVHRVQRVPETETQGRVHTSATSVIVLPEPEDVDFELSPVRMLLSSTRLTFQLPSRVMVLDGRPT